MVMDSVHTVHTVAFETLLVILKLVRVIEMAKVMILVLVMNLARVMVMVVVANLVITMVMVVNLFKMIR